MINIVSTPSQWTSAYQPCKYVIQDFNTYLGPYTVASHTVTGQYKITVGVGVINRFAIGDVLQIVSGFQQARGVVVSLTATEVIFTTTLPTGFVLTGTYFNQYPFKKQRFILRVGYRSGNPGAVDKPLSDYVECISVPKVNTFNDFEIDVRGYLQSALKLIEKPVYLDDKDLPKFLHYQLFLKVDDDTLFTIGGIKYVLNATLDSLNASLYATTGKPLIDDNPIVIIGEKFIQNRIVGDSIESETITAV